MSNQSKQTHRNAANLNADTDFPYFVRHAENGVFSEGDVGFGVMHWHEDLQFIYVLEGIVCVKTLEEEEIISAGEGVFTNKSVIHCSIVRSNPCRYILFRFPKKLVSFYLGSRAEQLTRAITEHTGISLVPLAPEVSWCAEVLRLLQRLAWLEEEIAAEDPLYIYEVLTCLCRIWLMMLRHIEVPAVSGESVIRQRMRHMLKFIEGHYAEDVTMEEIAESAGVSKSEALRCFHESLQTTPYRYLMDYRLSKAARLLAETALPVSEIMIRCGFHQQSYFGKCFKERTGMSPKAYQINIRHKKEDKTNTQ